MVISRYVQRGRLSKEAPVHLHERRNDGNADGEGSTPALFFFCLTANTSQPKVGSEENTRTGRTLWSSTLRPGMLKLFLMGWNLLEKDLI